MTEPFGTLSDGREVEVLTLRAGALTLRLLTLGSITQDIRLDGVPHALVIGSPELAPYEGPGANWGPVVGPVANRIGGSAAEIDGVRHAFEPAKSGPILHGGKAAIGAKLWRVLRAAPHEALLALDLPDGEGGFPGNRRLTARWTLSAPALIDLVLTGETDAPTLLNLAHHPYWTLDGAGGIEGQLFQTPAEAVLETEDRLPTGRVLPVGGTEYDFRAPRALVPGEPDLDHNFCLAPARRALAPAARLTGRGGLVLEIATTEPGIQVHDGSMLRPAEGHDGPVAPYAGFALEPQLWPDAPNHPAFPSILLRPGETYRQHTRYSLSES